VKPEGIVRELYKAFNERGFERAAAAFAESCEYESIAAGSVMRTGAAVRGSDLLCPEQPASPFPQSATCAVSADSIDAGH